MIQPRSISNERPLHPGLLRYPRSSVPWVLALILVPQLCLAQEEDSQRQYRLFTANIAGQGEVFSGRVVEETQEGWKPLREGTQITFSGRVLDGRETPQDEVDPVVATVSADGFVPIPSFDQPGNRFLYWNARESRGDAVQAHHVEVVAVPERLETRIHQTSEVINDGGLLRLEGQGFSFERVTLEASDGEIVDAGKPVGSSLQQVVAVPPLPRRGAYRVVAIDGEGNRYASPNLSVAPEMTARGDEVRRLGQRGSIRVHVDVFGLEGLCITLSGGQPNIDLDYHQACLHGEDSVTFPFTAKVVGDYEVGILLTSYRDRPTNPSSEVESVPDTVDVERLPTETDYNPRRDSTEVTTRARLTDSGGKPVAGVAVVTVTTSPDGVEYEETVTNEEGIAGRTLAYPGTVTPAEVSYHVYEVPGSTWSTNKEHDTPVIPVDDGEDGNQISCRDVLHVRYLYARDDEKSFPAEFPVPEQIKGVLYPQYTHSVEHQHYFFGINKNLWFINATYLPIFVVRIRDTRTGADKWFYWPTFATTKGQEITGGDLKDGLRVTTVSDQYRFRSMGNPGPYQGTYGLGPYRVFPGDNPDHEMVLTNNAATCSTEPNTQGPQYYVIAARLVLIPLNEDTEASQVAEAFSGASGKVSSWIKSFIPDLGEAVGKKVGVASSTADAIEQIADVVEELVDLNVETAHLDLEPTGAFVGGDAQPLSGLPASAARIPVLDNDPAAWPPEGWGILPAEHADKQLWLEGESRSEILGPYWPLIGTPRHFVINWEADVRLYVVRGLSM